MRENLNPLWLELVKHTFKNYELILKEVSDLEFVFQSKDNAIWFLVTASTDYLTRGNINRIRKYIDGTSDGDYYLVVRCGSWYLDDNEDEELVAKLGESLGCKSELVSTGPLFEGILYTTITKRYHFNDLNHNGNGDFLELYNRVVVNEK